MISETTRLDVIANNLANVNTAGFKRGRSVHASYPSMEIFRVGDQSQNRYGPSAGARLDRPLHVGPLGTGTWVDHIEYVMEPGPFRFTGEPLDLAIEGDAFFVVSTPRGERYTRAGEFSIDPVGRIVTQSGEPLLGERGEITLPPGTSPERIVVTREGEVIVEGVTVDRILVAEFESPSRLQREGRNLLAESPESGAPEPVVPGEGGIAINQGYLEGSNVNAVEELVNMIEATRVYEANQRVILAQDESLSKAVNEVGRV